MVDPLSIVSVVEGSIGLALQCGSAAKALNSLIARFKNSELTLMAMVEEVETIKFAWTRIREWFEGQGNEAIDDKFLERLSKSLRCGTLVISALVQDLADFDNGTTTSSFKKRSRMAWNERTLMDHQQRIRGQVQAMSLMLQVLELPNPKARIELLQTNELKLREYDESAYSIVPSRMSSRLSSRPSLRLSDSESISHSHVGADSRTMVYRRLSFEDDLFTARVYKRNYRNVWTSSLSHNTLRGKAEDLLHTSSRSIRTTTTESNRNPRNSSFDDVTQRVKSPEDIIESYNDHQGFHSIHEALHRAVESRNVDDARILLMNGGEINHPHGSTVSAWTNLHYAAYRGDTAMAEVLLLAGVDIAGQAADGMQPLHVACANENEDHHDHHLTEAIRLFLDTGADANCVDGIGRRPLHLASMRDNPQVIRLLVSRGADLEAEIGQIRGRTPLQAASSCFGNISSVRTLLELGANVNIEPPSSYIPLEAAVFGNELEIVEELLQHGADPNLQCAGNTETIVIRYASWFADCSYGASYGKGILKTIIEHGADIHAQDRAGNQILHFFAPHMLFYTCNDNRGQLIQYLIQKGADPNAQNHKQETPLSLAILRCDFLFVRLVLASGKGYLSLTEIQRLTQCLLEQAPTRRVPLFHPDLDEMIALLNMFPSPLASYLGNENTKTNGSSNEMEVRASDAVQQIPGSENADHVMIPTQGDIYKYRVMGEMSMFPFRTF